MLSYFLAMMEIVPATPADLPFIALRLRAWRLDDERVDAAQFLVAREGERILGFGRIKPYDGVTWELGSLGVVEEARGRGVGARLVEALIQRFPSDDVYITTDLPDYFLRFGFAPITEIPPPLQDKLDRVCGTLRSGVVAMALRRC